MAGTKPNSTSFKKGKPPGPGRTPFPPDVKQAKALTRARYEELVNKYIDMSLEELHACSRRKDITALEGLVISLIVKGITQGDPVRLNFLIERLIGKPREPKIPIDLRVGRVPAQTELLSSTMQISFAEIERLRVKAHESGLDERDHKSLALLSRSIVDMSQKMDDAPEVDEIRSLSDEELLERAQKATTALKLVVKNAR